MTESRFQKHVVHELRKRGFLVLLTGGRGSRGVPDLHVESKSYAPFWAELKTEQGKLSPHQLELGREIQAVGGSWVVWRPSTFKIWLDDYDNYLT